jgi:hypothetical protein
MAVMAAPARGEVSCGGKQIEASLVGIVGHSCCPPIGMFPYIYIFVYRRVTVVTEEATDLLIGSISGLGTGDGQP